MGSSSRDHAHSSSDGQGNPTLAAFDVGASVLEAVGRAIEAANVCRAVGLFDYSIYPGDGPPHVVRDFRLGRKDRVFSSYSRTEARAVYDALAARFLGEVAINALRAALSDGEGRVPSSTTDADRAPGTNP